MSRGHEGKGGIADDAPEGLARIGRWLAVAESHGSGAAVELYHRESTSLIVGVGQSENRDWISGREEGLALRRAGESSEFAACSGSGRDRVEHLIAGTGPVPGAAGGPAWPVGAAQVVDDDAGEMPTASDLRAWLDRALERFHAAGDGRGPLPDSAQVEVARIRETWAASGGFRARRTRTRGWAVALPGSRDPHHDRPKPIFLAARRWSQLPQDGWIRAIEDRGAGAEPGNVAALDLSIPLVFTPECSAYLVHGLVHALASPGQPVGAGCRVIDSPDDEDAIFGGDFDDAGFATSSHVLADGKRWCRVPLGPGYLARASFRDPPAPRAVRLLVAPSGAEAPDRATLVTGLDIHPLEPERWALEITGALLEHGAVGRPFARSVLFAAPGELARRWVGTVGAARESHNGVRTPGIVLDSARG